MAAGEIIMVPFPHPGHLFPATELCIRLAERNRRITLILPTASSFSSPAPLHPLIQTVELPVADDIRIDPSFLETALPDFLTHLLSDRRDRSSLPICAIVDEMIGWIAATFVDFGVPAVSFFTSSAVSSALEHAASQIPTPEEPGHADSINIHPVPGLPEHVALTASDLVHHQRSGGPVPFGPRLTQDGRPRRRRDIVSTGGAIGLNMNTCIDLERPFLDYVAREARKPVWAVGPLLPDRFWSAAGGPFRDEEVRARRREARVSESEILSWLDARPSGSVVYVSFGSLVSPSSSELEELAAGLEDSGRPFIWVVQPGARQHDPNGRPIVSDGYFPDGLEKRVAGRGMVIEGWAPQLMILSHPSTGGYVCHCGWNSALEALGCGVPVLAWPVRGDQQHNAKLLVSQLGMGVPVRATEGEAVSRGDIVRGIEKLMTDEAIRKHAASVRSVFAQGLPRSSAAALDSFLEFLGSG